MSEQYDIVVAGGGHNGIVAACYLAKAGLKVCVVEKNEKAGGGVMTSELTVPGFKHDVCSLAHTLIQPNPLILHDELKLKAKYGLKYLHPDKMTSLIFDDGRTLEIYTDFEKTAQSIAKFSEKDAVAYRRFIKSVDQNLDLLVMGMYNTTMSTGQQAMMMDQSPEGQELLRVMSMSAWDYMSEHFSDDRIKIAMARYASEAMYNPFDNGTGFGFYACLPLMHRYGTGIPVGGSGALVEALLKCLDDYGGVVKTASPIKQFKISGVKATGVILECGEEILAKRAVISNLHVQQMFPDMVPGATLPEYFTERVKKVKFSTYAPFSVNLALHEAPKYKVGSSVDECFWVESAHSDVEEFRVAFNELDRGIPRRDFIAYVAPDAVDKGSRAPDGKRVLNLYALNTYNLKGGGPKKWDEIGREVANGYLDDLRAITTNMGDDNIVGMKWLTPLDIERHNNAMIQGDLQHFGVFNWQLGGNRPVPGWSQYKSPVEQLYMTGASTHPGGGVTAASGRNVARVIMDEFGMDFDKIISD